MLDGRSLQGLDAGVPQPICCCQINRNAMDFDAFAKIGSRMGAGLMMVIDDTQSVVSVVR